MAGLIDQTWSGTVQMGHDGEDGDGFLTLYVLEQERTLARLDFRGKTYWDVLYVNYHAYLTWISGYGTFRTARGCGCCTESIPIRPVEAV